MEKTLNLQANYLCNPDVVIREEDVDGALLFNPDTNQVKVINGSGLFIWKQFIKSNSPQRVVGAVVEAFEEAEETQVRTDLEEFLSEMLGTGFIGEVEENLK